MERATRSLVDGFEMAIGRHLSAPEFYKQTQTNVQTTLNTCFFKIFISSVTILQGKKRFFNSLERRDINRG
jgi:hypothetical protein